ncbi:barstar family protein [Plantactinospora soyae]|uniref:Barstar (barnase inhibitor) domain-containing protein n=1 Tax=Plantactinospora soyae TaxID=1544732 RepID=A0A927M8D3_9ACTN|nr:barstar family protein [Plantactinospora soyae]MBE1489849.1 hypothetical protein [Plantactinospora soyae]
MPEQSEPAPPSWLTVSTDPAPPGATPVSGAVSRTRAGLFTEWAARLRFPEHFGRNWDAFEDCLTDVVTERPRTLVVTDAAELLADEPVGQLGILLAVLGTIAGRTTTGPAGPALRVILHAGPAGDAELRRRLAAAST